MLRRGERREERREGGPGEPGGGGANRYQMRQKLVSFGDDFWIENGRGERVFRVDGKALRVRETLIFEDAHGGEQCKIQQRMLRVKDTMEIEGPGGERLAVVKKAMITPLRERFSLNIRGGPDIEIQGNLLQHEYKFERGRDRVAEVSQRWFRVRDTYGVEIDPGQEDILILAATVCIDEMVNPGR